MRAGDGNFSTPLGNYPVVRTYSVEEARNAVARLYAEPVLEPIGRTKGLNAVINNCRLRHISLGYAAYGAAVRLQFPATDFFVKIALIRGESEITSGKSQVTLDGGYGALISPEMGYSAACSENCERLFLQVDAQALTAKLAAITGQAINRPLRMDPRADFTRPVARSLHEYLTFLVETLNGADTPLPDWWIEQTEQLLMVLFLFGHRHNYSHLLQQEPPDVAHAQVRRAEEYIEAHWRRSISLEELAEISGVSAFSLFRSFKKIRGYSPLEFASRLRFKRTRQN